MAEQKTATTSGKKMPLIILGIGALLAIGGGVVWYTNKSSSSNNQNLGNVGPSAVNGKWSDWSDCENKNGVCKKRRTCIAQPQNGGKPCSEIDGGDAERLCDPVNGNWYNPPDSVDVCSQKLDDNGNPMRDSDGRVIWVKQKTCTNPAPCNGGSPCAGSAEERCQPINGNWSSLEDAKCEVVTDSGGVPLLSDGRQTYRKTVTCTPGKFGGSDCPNIPNAIRDGNTAYVVCNSTDGVWGEWGTCNDQQRKGRVCTAPSNGGRPCVDEYPIFALNVNNDRGYRAEASSSLTDWRGNTFPACLAFDQAEGTFWHSDVTANNQYNISTGQYQGTASTVAVDLQNNQKEFKGEWIQLSLPMKELYAYNLLGFRLKGRAGLEANRCPRQFAIVARSFSGPWRILFDNTMTEGVRNWSSAEKTFWLENYSATIFGFDTVRLIAVTIGNQTSGGTNQDWFNLNKWSLLATIRSDTEVADCYSCLDRYAGVQASAWSGTQSYLLYRNAGRCWESAGQWTGVTGCSPMALPEGLKSKINSTTCEIPAGQQITEGSSVYQWAN